MGGKENACSTYSTTEVVLYHPTAAHLLANYLELEEVGPRGVTAWKPLVIAFLGVLAIQGTGLLEVTFVGSFMVEMTKDHVSHFSQVM